MEGADPCDPRKIMGSRHVFAWLAAGLTAAALALALPAVVTSAIARFLAGR